MKKLYTTPSVEKIAFRYRDQVVAASGTDPLTEDTNPAFGSLTQEVWGVGGCKVHALEAASWNICNYA